MVLLDFIRQAKAHVGDVKYISLGNTSGDLDSICSAIADAWISSTPDRIFCPVLNFPRADFRLRVQQTTWLNEVIGAKEDDFVFYEDIDWHKVAEPHKLNIKDVHLVDHNVLQSEQIYLSPKVSSVIDHHAPVGSWPEGVYTNIVVPLGSCASLLALQMPENAPLELWRLLWGPIIVDTVNFDESLRDQRWVQMDVDAAAAIPEEAKKKHDYKYLSDLKFDVDTHAKLSTLDLLRIDYKEATYPAAKIGYAAIPISTHHIAWRDSFSNDIREYSRNRNVRAIVMSSFFRANGKMQRELSVYSEDKDCLNTFDKLSSALDLHPIGDIPCFQMYKQGDVTMSRKFIEPLISALFQHVDDDDEL